jgi:hypothetical protein
MGSLSPVRGGHDPESGRRAIGKKSVYIIGYKTVLIGPRKTLKNEIHKAG